MVRSRDVNNSPAIFDRRDLARGQKNAYRMIAAGFYTATMVGSLLFGGGGLDRWLALQPLLLGVLTSAAVQLILSWIQYTFCDDWRQIPYLAALVGSVALSSAGYLPLIVPPLAAPLATFLGTPWIVAAVLISAPMVFVFVFVDIVPERILAA